MGKVLKNGHSRQSRKLGSFSALGSWNTLPSVENLSIVFMYRVQMQMKVLLGIEHSSEMCRCRSHIIVIQKHLQNDPHTLNINI